MKLNRLFCLLLCIGLLAGLLALPAMAAGIQIQVQTSHQVTLGQTLDLHCTATSASGAPLSYLWYETATGKLEDTFAVNRGTETTDTFRCDTTELGTRYYTCFVTDGTAGIYSELITVRVVSESGELSVVFTADSEPVTGGTMTVDIKKMAAYDPALQTALTEGKVSYAWYRNGARAGGGTASMTFSDADAGSTWYVEVTGGSTTVRSEQFQVERLVVAPEIETTTLPEATVGQKYTAQLRCYEDGAEFFVYYDPDKANEFDKTGLTLAADGTLAGVPPTAGSFTFTVCAGNDGGEDYATYTLTVSPAPTDPTQTTEGTTQPTETTAPSTAPTGPDQQQEDVPAVAPGPADTDGAANETAGETGPTRTLAVGIVLVIVLAVLAGAAAIVVIVILLTRRKR